MIPLSPTALGLFRELRQLAEALGDSEEEKRAKQWVMASAVADCGHYTEKALGRAMRRLFTAGRLTLPGGEASPHDLRRTMRTHLGKLRVPPHISERCLNHSLGRIEKTYDVGDYLDERREALERWDLYVRRLLDPAASNVVTLPAAAAAGGAA